MNGGIGFDGYRGIFRGRGFKDDGGDKVASIGDGSGKEDAAGLGFAAQEGKVLHHQVLVTFGDVPARALPEQAEEIRLEVARDVRTPGTS